MFLLSVLSPRVKGRKVDLKTLPESDKTGVTRKIFLGMEILSLIYDKRTSKFRVKEYLFQ